MQKHGQHNRHMLSIQCINLSITFSLCCRRRGGAEEERAERQRWNQKEQQKIMDSVKGLPSLIVHG